MSVQMCARCRCTESNAPSHNPIIRCEVNDISLYLAALGIGASQAGEAINPFALPALHMCCSKHDAEKHECQRTILHVGASQFLTKVTWIKCTMCLAHICTSHPSIS